MSNEANLPAAESASSATSSAPITASGTPQSAPGSAIGSGLESASKSASAKSMDAIMSLCKRRGFVYQASEIYGGINGFWDYGPLGTLLKRNLREAWIQDVVMNPCWGKLGPDGKPVEMVMVDTRIIQHPKVWEASGHLAGFTDPMRKCPSCGHFVRADHLWDVIATQSEWFNSLLQEFTPISGEIDSPRLMKWARGKGKRLAPNLALVCNPEVTLSWLTQRVVGQPDAKPDLQEIARYVATEQLHSTGLQDPCPRCGGVLDAPSAFKLMFESWAGVIQTDANKVYLRPETAQGIFVQAKNVWDTNRVRVPFGIAQTGTSFRNEVTPRNFTFRSREFEQMEIEFFVVPPEHLEGAEKDTCGPLDWYKFFRDWRMAWWQKIGLAGENLILREHEKDELAHYSQATSDIEYRFPFSAPGYGELEGIAYRGNYDLTQHQKHSGTKLEYRDTARGDVLPNGSRRGVAYLPHVIEPSAGLDRGVLALLCEAYTVDATRPSPEFMKFHPRVAPIKAAVFPLVDKDGMPEVAAGLYAELKKKFGHLGMIETDSKQSIGKRYARMDEAGCPFCFTVDGDTLKDQTVTVRDRDTGKQERIGIDGVVAFLAEKLGV